MSVAHESALTVLWIISVLPNPSRQYVDIELKNSSESLGGSFKYEDRSVFTNHFTNIPGDGDINGGYVWKWESFPTNGCQFIEPLPYADGSNETIRNRWFALIEGISSCPDEMVKNVRNAGFELVIAYNNGSSNPPNLFKSLRDSDFPIISVTSDYWEKLWEVAATDSPTNRSVTVDVSVQNVDIIVIVSICSLLLSFFGAVVTICSVVFKIRQCYKSSNCCSCLRREADLTAGFNLAAWINRSPTARPAELQEEMQIQLPPVALQHSQNRRGNNTVLSNFATPLELGLQLELLLASQFEHGPCSPLGEEATGALPQEVYANVCRESSGQKNCVVCMEQFKETEKVRILPCRHYFHLACFDHWLIRHSTACPICKQSALCAHAQQVLVHVSVLCLSTILQARDTVLN